MSSSDDPPGRGAGDTPGESAARLPEPVYRLDQSGGIDELIRLLDLLSDRVSRSDSKLRDSLRPLADALDQIEALLVPAQREGDARTEEPAPYPSYGNASYGNAPEPPPSTMEALADTPPGTQAPRTDRRHMSLEERIAYFSERGPAAVEKPAWGDMVPERAIAPTDHGFAEAKGSTRESGGRFFYYMGLGVALAISVAAGYWAFTALFARTADNGRNASVTASVKKGLPDLEAVLEAHPLRLDPPSLAEGETLALDRLTQEAELGDPGAALTLGLAYATGTGVAKDELLAVRWLRTAAEQGRREAQFALAALYATGSLQTADKRRAQWWLQTAAENGHPEAALIYGLRLLTEGEESDQPAGVGWIARAAREGSLDAAFLMGAFYERGFGGLKRNAGNAYGWYSLAALGGSTAAAANAATLETRLTADDRKSARVITQDFARLFVRPASPRTAPGAGQDAGGTGADENLIARIQALLIALEFDPGPANGILTPETRAAIRTYQSFAGLPETGEPSAELLAHLEAVSSAAIPKPPATEQPTGN